MSKGRKIYSWFTYQLDESINWNKINKTLNQVMNISLQKYFGYPIAYISKNVHISGKKHPKTGYFSILTTMTKCVVNKL